MHSLDMANWMNCEIAVAFGLTCFFKNPPDGVVVVFTAAQAVLIPLRCGFRLGISDLRSQLRWSTVEG
jgi:hypothetical protein